MDTGRRNDARRRLCIAFARETFTFRFADAPERFVALFREFYGPTMNAFAAAQQAGKAAQLQGELEQLFRAQNRAGRADHTEIPATFLRVTVRR